MNVCTEGYGQEVYRVGDVGRCVVSAWVCGVLRIAARGNAVGALYSGAEYELVVCCRCIRVFLKGVQR